MRVLEVDRFKKNVSYWVDQASKEPVYVSNNTQVVAVILGVKHLTKEQLEQVFENLPEKKVVEHQKPPVYTPGDCYPNACGNIGVTKPATLSAMFCEHANETPSTYPCACPEHCYCRREGNCWKSHVEHAEEERKARAAETEKGLNKTREEMDFLSCHPPEAGGGRKRRKR